MNTSDADRELAAEVWRIKQAALKHSMRVVWTLGVLAIVGVIVGVSVWFGQIPMNRDQMHSTLAIGSGTAMFCIGSIVGWALFPKPAAQCPKCGCDWYQETDNSSTWLDWNSCPRCGLFMTPDGLAGGGG
jgi:hypothetical protein